MNRARGVAIAGTGICFALAAAWIGAPQFVLWIWQMNGSDSTLLMARRGAACFLGVAILLWLARNIAALRSKQAVIPGERCASPE